MESMPQGEPERFQRVMVKGPSLDQMPEWLRTRACALLGPHATLIGAMCHEGRVSATYTVPVSDRIFTVSEKD